MTNVKFIKEAIKNIKGAIQHDIGGDYILIVVQGHGFIEVEKIRDGVIANNRISVRVISDDELEGLAEYIENTFDLEYA